MYASCAPLGDAPGGPPQSRSVGGGGTSGSTSGGTGAVSAPRSFAQGVFRGQDTRITQRNGFYYYTGFVGQTLKLWKYKSMVDPGVGKDFPAGMNNTLFAPVYIDKVGNTEYNTWYVFGPSIWSCKCADPYDNIDQWKEELPELPFTVGAFDFEVFKNPQPGPFQNRWYLMWVGTEPGGPAESIYIAEILGLTAGQPVLSTYNSVPTNATNRFITYHYDWTDIITEAPGVAIDGNTVTVAYSGNGAQTSLYSVGYSILKMGQDPSLATSWMDYSHNECDGNVHTGPEFAKNANALGVGVARFVKSPDGQEDWMMYHAKVWDTYDPAAGKPEPQQVHNEEYNRYLNLQKFIWQKVTCGGQIYSIPNMGSPQAPGFVQPLPSGDVGLAPRTQTFRIEAESMIPFGTVMGPAIQSLPTQNTVVISPVTPGASESVLDTYFDALATNDPNKQSGLISRNTPAGTHLTVASAGTAAGSFDLVIDGKPIQTLTLQATGSATTVMLNKFDVAIPAGCELKLLFTLGKSVPAALDYIEISP